MKIIPSIKLPIINNGEISNHVLSRITENKKVIIFGVPGAFTPTCSEKHLPSFLNLFDQLKKNGVDDIYCIAVNDAFVMKAWLASYSKGNSIKGIADGNAEFAKEMDLLVDYSGSFMGNRNKRFALIADQNEILKMFVEEKGQFFVSSAEHILSQLSSFLKSKSKNV